MSKNWKRQNEITKNMYFSLIFFYVNTCTKCTLSVLSANIINVSTPRNIKNNYIILITYKMSMFGKKWISLSQL